MTTIVIIGGGKRIDDAVGALLSVRSGRSLHSYALEWARDAEECGFTLD